MIPLSPIKPQCRKVSIDSFIPPGPEVPAGIRGGSEGEPADQGAAPGGPDPAGTAPEPANTGSLT